jgi:hypothetical protein
MPHKKQKDKKNVSVFFCEKMGEKYLIIGCDVHLRQTDRHIRSFLHSSEKV